MTRKICLKCLDLKSLFVNEEHCSYCGSKLAEFNLVCECGTEVNPHFWYRIFRPWSKEVINKCCPNCGRDIRKPVKDYLKKLKKE